MQHKPGMLWLVTAVALACGSSAHAGVGEGLNALRKGDYAAAAKELRPAAEQGDAEAQYRIGLMYEFGKGYPTDKAQAIAWLRRAAGQGHAAAQTELGILYMLGDGVPADAAQAVSWFRKGAEQGNRFAQYNLGLLIAKGEGAAKDDAQAVAWMRKAADQGLEIAQFKVGVAYDNGQGVAKDPVLAYADFIIAARGGNKEYVAYRDEAAKALTPAQLSEAQAIAAAWQPGKPMPMRTAAAAAVARGPDTCSATGSMEGEKFTATHCAVAFYGDQRSVAIWFNEDPIAPDEVKQFALSSYADGAKGGKQRTMATIMFCPGGGGEAAQAGAVKSIDLNTNHAKSAMAGVQWVVESPKDFKVEKMSGEAKPGGALAGRIVGSRGKTSFTFDFDVALPAKDAAAGMTCRK